jgi:hypothetical protein
MGGGNHGGVRPAVVTAMKLMQLCHMYCWA